MNGGTITGVLECVRESNTSRAITMLLQLRPVGPESAELFFLIDSQDSANS